MEQDIPIDIHIPKLLEWLISRRHCKTAWQPQITPIREKINSAIQDMPENEEIKELLSGSYLNYFHCLRIVDILKGTEADTKNLFGMYGSQRMKDWQEIIRMYQKDNLYLAEAANILLRNVKYEIPNMKKQITKLKQTQQECDKKVGEYVKGAASARKELESMKKQLGISGNDVRKELLSRVSYLTEVYEKVISEIKALEKPVQYYTTFSQFVAGVSYKLPVLSHIIEKGNTSLHEFMFGEKVEIPVVNNPVVIAEEENTNVEIDWDISADVEIDFNYDDFTLEESGIEVEMPGKATEHKKETVLDYPETRNEFLAQLYELQSFLKMRLLQMQKENDGISLINDQVQESAENIVKMLDSVQVVEQLMTDSTVQQLHFIKHSKRYVDKVALTYGQKVNSIEKMVASQEAVKSRKEELIQEEQDLKPKQKLLIDKTRLLQEQIEEDISKKYKNRPVNLLGGL